MKIQQAIEKAIEEGFLWEEEREGHKGKIVVLNKYWFEYHDTYKIPADGYKNDFTNIHKFNTHWIFLKPSFWQSLGKALGWGSCGTDPEGNVCWTTDKDDTHWNHGIEKMHAFIDHLAEDKTIESYFETL